MRRLPFLPLARRGCIFGIVNALLAIGLTVVSFRYVQPTDCFHLCDEPNGTTCPSGACRFGEQKAGWPVPAFVDAPGGGSPTGGWAMLGPEDPPLLGPMILDVLFYSLLLWLALCTVQLVRGQTPSLLLIATTLPLNILMAACLWFSFIAFQAFGFFGSYTYIGRGHMVPVLVDIPTSGLNSVEGFSPFVSIPLGDLIEKYGDPNYVRFDPQGQPNAPTNRMALYWDSIRMSVALPEMKNKIYAVKKTTDVELIIFFNKELYSGFSEIPFGAEKILWRGYGLYHP